MRKENRVVKVEIMNMYVQLAILAIVPLSVSVLVFLFDDRTKLKKIPYPVRQIIIGIIFGMVTVFCSEMGVEVNGAVANTRDAAILCAGLIFGGPAGIIAGIIGAVERWFSVSWGGGEYTRLACTLACLISGFLSAFLHKFVYERKIPSKFQGMIVAVGVEIIHLGLVFWTRSDNMQQTLFIVKAVSFPMIAINAITVFCAVGVVFLIKTGKFSFLVKKEERTISEIFQNRFLLVMVVAFAFTSLFTTIVQKNLAIQNTERLLNTTIKDVEYDIKNGLPPVENRHVGEDGSVIVFKDGVINTGTYVESEGFMPGDILGIVEKEEENELFSLEKNGHTFYASYMNAFDGSVILGIYPEETANFNLELTLYSNGYIEVLVFFVIYLCVFFVVKNNLAKKMDKINEKLSLISAGNLDEKIEIRDTKEFAGLSDDINSTVDKLKEYIDDAQKRIEAELIVAKSIQESVLPNVHPYFSQRKEFEIYATMRTAKEVGGDFYDFFDVDEDNFAFLIADVSGKGIPAAMFMMNAKNVIRNLIEEKYPADEVFTMANNRLCENNEYDMFVTAWLMIVNKKSGDAVYVNAGHNPPVLKHKDGEFEFLKSRPDLVLAGMEDIRYSKKEIKLQKDDILFLYTDGVTEGTDAKENLYGEDRLCNILNEILKENPETSMENICIKVNDNLKSFVGEAPQFDDITMLAFRFTN